MELPTFMVDRRDRGLHPSNVGRRAKLGEIDTFLGD